MHSESSSSISEDDSLRVKAHVRSHVGELAALHIEKRFLVSSFICFLQLKKEITDKQLVHAFVCSHVALLKYPNGI